MRTASDIKILVRSKLLVLRNIYRIISTDNFKDLYNRVCDTDRELINKTIDQYNQIELGKLITKLSKSERELATYTIRELRQIARKYRIIGYCFLPKANLLSEIIKYEQSHRIINVDEAKPKNIETSIEGIERLPRSLGTRSCSEVSSTS